MGFLACTLLQFYRWFEFIADYCFLCCSWVSGASVSLVLPGGLLYDESLGSFEACVVLNSTTAIDVTVNLTTVGGTAQGDFR